MRYYVQLPGNVRTTDRFEFPSRERAESFARFLSSKEGSVKVREVSTNDAVIFTIG